MNKEELRQILINKFSTPTYIGDSVYIHFDGYHFILETRNGFSNDPRNRIGLEPDVIHNLLAFRENCYRAFEDLNNNNGGDE